MGFFRRDGALIVIGVLIKVGALFGAGFFVSDGAL